MTSRDLGSGTGGGGRFPLVDLSGEELDRLHAGIGEIENLLPLTAMQQGMLYHSVEDPQQYLVQFATTLTGELHVGAFRRAWDAVLAHNDILRGSVRWQGLRVPTMVVEPDVRMPFTVRDLRHLTPEAAEAEIEAFMVADRRLGVEPSRAPMQRIICYRVGDAEHRVIWTLHHILADGWGSWRAIWEDVTTVYHAEVDGTPVVLPPRGRWTEFLSWLGDRDFTTAEQVWRRSLAGHRGPTFLSVPPPANPPADDVSDPIKETSILTLPDEEFTEIREFARIRGVRVDTLVNAAWALLLGRYAGSTAVTYGSITSGRRTAKLPKAGRMVGMFLNTLPFHVDVAPEESTMDFLTRLEADLDELRKYEYVPLPKIREWAGVPSGEDLFASILIVENSSIVNRVRGSRGGIEVSDTRTTERLDYPLVGVILPGKKLEFGLLYDTRRIEGELAEQMLPHLADLLLGLVRNPGVRPQDLSMGSAAEREVVEASNRTDRPYPQGSVHGLVEAQAVRTPDVVAVSDGRSSLTYRELVAKAETLAYRLVAAGVGRDRRVGVYLDRSVDTAVALLAILKAGGAYVPLDPDYPAERNAFLVSDSEAMVVVTNAALAEDAEGLRVPLFAVDDPAAPIEGVTLPEAAPNDLAYVIYTSGSTGVPKGVGVEHRNVTNLARWAAEEFSGDELSSVFASTSLCFDLSVFEIFVPLAVGGTVVLAGSVLDLVHFGEAGIRLINTVPSFLTAAVDAEIVPASAGTVCLGGEAWTPKLAASVGGLGTVDRLLNLYGPTETTVYSLRHEVDPGREDTVPLGGPIANTQAHVLDELLRPVPFGVIGELYIGGHGVTRGYLGRPELTAERFLDTDLGRLYRTGDLALRTADGTLEYFGRTDQQVKLRGHRIELGEVESVLLAHPDVTEAAVTLDDGKAQLVAYFAGGEVSAEDLRAHLAERLPRYMVPAVFHRADTLPKTHNGKLDRKALSTVDAEDRVLGDSTVEATLTTIFTEVLGRSDISVHDDLVALGCDSIASIRVVAKALRAGLRFTSRELFANRTIARLAQAASAETRIRTEQGTIVGPAPVTPAQLALLADAEADPARWTESLSLEIAPGVEAELLEKALGQLVEHHDALRLVFEPGDVGWWQHHRLAGEPFSLGDQLDLAEGPLLLARIEGSRLTLTAHRFVLDTVSWRILLGDLHRILAGGDLALPAKTSSYRQWAQSLADASGAPAAAGELAYWQRAITPVAALPVDHDRGPNNEGSARRVTVEVGEGETSALLRRTRGVAELLVTATAQALARRFGESELLFEVEGHGRRDLFGDLDLSRTVGNFTALHPLRLSVPEDSAAARKAVVEAFKSVPRSGAAFGALRHMCRFAGECAALPVPEVGVRYTGALDRVMPDDSPLKVLTPAAHRDQDPLAARRTLFDVEGVVVDGKLQLTVVYSENRHTAETATDLAATIGTALHTLVDVPVA
jgi:amino acid adenylation domain-containing protein/non-ribosomal peptide synthase protein (TIGR01720 family)